MGRPGTRRRLPDGGPGTGGPDVVVVVGSVVAVAAVSSAAVLIRTAEAGALAVAFWRTAGGTVVLAPWAWRHRRILDRRRVAGVTLAGVALAAHFGLWIGSLSLTSVASSVTLVTTSPVLVALAGPLLGERASARTWGAVTVGVVGAAVIALADHTGGRGPDPLVGDVMALGGAVAVAGYLLVGRHLRSRGMPTAAYATGTYGVAAAVLGPVTVLAGQPLGGYDAATWWVLGALVVGPQLAGHTVLNHLLERLSATAVSVTVLAEPVGAALLAWVLLGEAPPAGFWAGAPLVLAGVLAVER